SRKRKLPAWQDRPEQSACVRVLDEVDATFRPILAGVRYHAAARRSALEQFLHKLGIELPIIQAPMAGVSTPEMAAAVSNAGGLGSVGVGSVDAEAARQMIAAVRSRTDRPFNVNVFCHRPAAADAAREAAWLARLGPEFA